MKRRKFRLNFLTKKRAKTRPLIPDFSKTASTFFNQSKAKKFIKVIDSLTVWHTLRLHKLSCQNGDFSENKLKNILLSLCQCGTLRAIIADTVPNADIVAFINYDILSRPKGTFCHSVFLGVGSGGVGFSDFLCQLFLSARNFFSATDRRPFRPNTLGGKNFSLTKSN